MIEEIEQQTITSNEECYIFHGKRLLVLHTTDSPSAKVPLENEIDSIARYQFREFQWSNGSICKYVSIEENPPELPFEGEWVELRASYYILQSVQFKKASKAYELIDWDKQNLFCGHCGKHMNWVSAISKICPCCKEEVWPKLSPAVICLIKNKDKILLVKSKTFKKDFYGLVAGFVELGESIEEAIHREVLEETSLRVSNLQYFDSQVWPYPRNIMIGFFADYAGGELKIQEEELSVAGWFSKDNLPSIPETLSIARRMIDAWVNNQFPPNEEPNCK